jgi:hypothetical protein
MTPQEMTDDRQHHERAQHDGGDRPNPCTDVCRLGCGMANGREQIALAGAAVMPSAVGRPHSPVVEERLQEPPVRSGERDGRDDGEGDKATKVGSKLVAATSSHR